MSLEPVACAAPAALDAAVSISFGDLMSLEQKSVIATGNLCKPVNPFQSPLEI